MRNGTHGLVIAVALALASLPAAAQGFGPPGHGHGRGGGDPILHMAKELGLNDAQMAQVKTITSKYMDGALGQSIDSERQARMAAQKTIHDVTATDDQVREAASVVAVLESQIAVQHHQMAIEISAVLTPDQRTKLTEFFTTMKERHQGPPPDDSGGSGGF